MAVREELKRLLNQRKEVPRKIRSEFYKKLYEYPENFEEALFVFKEIQNDSTLNKVLNFVNTEDELKELYSYSKDKVTNIKGLDYGVDQGFLEPEYFLAQVYAKDIEEFQNGIKI